ncbi:TIM barrel protein [Acidisoma cellulosilytica]|uniref:TIM barrel protein n=1 Tax=Acidisoma cellulosilyticum TaxID=2802395 RepID=A0A964E450_9PROT|nr:sugar phosphate isomerase/epimerase family protein [Acidisoma cellulosilyticum]MCB8881325.1 TIM barrel protein [Acidisoma cellulosilyticum]
MSAKLAYHTNCWGPLGGHPVGVTSVKDLFYQTFGDMNLAFAEIAAAGYQAVEMFDGNLVDYAGEMGRFRGLLSDHGLQLLAIYSGGNFIYPDILEEEFWRIEKAAGSAAEAGATHFVIGGGAKRAGGVRPGDYARLGDALDRAAEIAEKHGLSAHYHPHLTTMAETPEDIREVFAHTRIGFCPDTAHLAAAGGDPAALIAEHFDRVTYVHLKGWQRKPFAFTPLDRGDLDLRPTLDLLRDKGFDGWIAVELDAWADPAAGASASMAWLKDNGLGGSAV